jgi:hypothetical protein
MRWWQDHRIPGGLGFSTNSVGHLVKSGQIAEKMSELQQLLEVADDALVATKINSLPTALEWAMRTIHGASDGPSGRATELLPLPSARSSTAPKCPVTLPKFLQDRDYCTYQGAYHTDVTIPSEYFLADVERPTNLLSHRLDFTYLFNSEIENPDFVTTASGRRVRGLDDELPGLQKSARATATTESIADHPRLIDALKESPPNSAT